MAAAIMLSRCTDFLLESATSLPLDTARKAACANKAEMCVLL